MVQLGGSTYGTEAIMKSEPFTNVMCIKRRLLMAFSSRSGGRMMNWIALLAWGMGGRPWMGTNAAAFASFCSLYFMNRGENLKADDLCGSPCAQEIDSI